MNALQRQLKTEYKQEAEDCIVIYNHLKETNDGKVWSSQWEPLTTVSFEGKYPNCTNIYKPNSIGYLILKGLKQKL